MNPNETFYIPTIARRVTSALEAATAGLPYGAYAPAVSAFLSAAAPSNTSPTVTRMDRAYAIVRETYLGGTTWTLNAPLSAIKAGIAELTLSRMRFAIRTLAAADVASTGVWLADQRIARGLAAASAGIAAPSAFTTSPPADA